MTETVSFTMYNVARTGVFGDFTLGVKGQVDIWELCPDCEGLSVARGPSGHKLAWVQQ